MPWQICGSLHEHRFRDGVTAAERRLSLERDSELPHSWRGKCLGNHIQDRDPCDTDAAVGEKSLTAAEEAHGNNRLVCSH
ncbi:hypothetical protein SAMN05421753_11779 [Planctomicrobium piriforme]|uniref:Uncharacterized protein n=1 Tax=Planctomicrobium piriforme TaxID=1576369 RepID=A0A1I3PY70_9PLAN|nr:hypothetical protein SAMN05421753_11779 [Planctomicrobium piriforme]